MTMVAETFSAFFGFGHVHVGCEVHGVDFSGAAGVLVAEEPREDCRLHRRGAHHVGPAMQELSHLHRLEPAADLRVSALVGGLQRHLEECVGREPHRGDRGFAVFSEI